MSKLSLYYPVSPARLNQGYGVNGEYYQANGINIVGHNGDDLAAFHGQPIYASHAGTAFYEEDDSSGHGVVIITDQQYDAPTGFDEDGDLSKCFFKTIYWHMCDPVKESLYASPIWRASGEVANSGKGVLVKTGDLIGYADSTGLSSGDHLHFGLKAIKKGKPLLSGDAPDVGIGGWVNLYPNNGYLGAIDPTPYFNGFFAPQSGQVIGILERLGAILRQYIFVLQQQIAAKQPELTATATLPTKQPNTVTPEPIASYNSNTAVPVKIVHWANTVSSGEGADPSSNNPGNLKYTTLTASWGATKGRAATDGGFLCRFPTASKGFDALCNFLILGAENELIAFHSPEARTLAGFMKVYAGNPPKQYIDRIVNAMGGYPEVDISTFLV